MKRLLLTSVVSALLVAAGSSRNAAPAEEKPGDKKPTSDQDVKRVKKEDAVKEDLKKLQGTWVVVKTVVNGKAKEESDIERITFTGNKLIFHVKVQTLVVVFAIDPSKKPKTIDLTFPAAATPDKKEFLFGQGIYLLEGDNLKLAFMTAEGRAAAFPRGRPAGFEGKDKSTTTILKRQRKDAKEDMARLQGTWVVVKTVADGQNKEPGQTEKITFAANRMIFHDKKLKDGGKSPEEQIIFSIDPSRKPKTIDLTFPGAATPTGKDFLFARGIYLLEGDNLKLAFMRSQGRGDLFPLGRPAGFEGKDKSTTTILKRRKVAARDNKQAS